MRRALLTLTAVLLLASGAGAKDKPFAPGTVTSCTTPGGVPYAVYVPKSWRKGRTLPLVVHVPSPHWLPAEWLDRPEYLEGWGGDAGPVFHCAILTESHNRQDGHLQARIDQERFLALLEKDAAVLATVLGEISDVLPVQSNAALLQGSCFAAEVAMGLAVRNPKEFAAVLLPSMCACTLLDVGDETIWRILEPRVDEPAGRHLHVYLATCPSDNDPKADLRLVRRVRGALGRYGYPHVDILGVGPNETLILGAREEAQARFLVLAAERRARAKLEADRDEMLAAGLRDAERDRLSNAVKTYRRVCAFEEEHELDAKSLSLWETLEPKGRAMLAEAGALPAKKQKAAYRKIARLFADTPLAEEVNTLLDGAK